MSSLDEHLVGGEGTDPFRTQISLIRKALFTATVPRWVKLNARYELWAPPSRVSVDR
ncbi:MAG: hypothetical protein ACI835_004910 [Planctomycetota bacterium]|jgi:hypothetical protein